MKDKILNDSRKWLCLIISIILYYIVHEGGHLIFASITNAFIKLKILGVGVQVIINDTILSNVELIIFNATGFISTLLIGYILVFLTKNITKHKSKILKGICYYTTFIFMFLDPAYLSILYKLVGGGDMNGLLLTGINEFILELIFVVIFFINLLIFTKKVYPYYKESFDKNK